MLKIVEFIKAHPDWETRLTTAPYSLKIKTQGNLVLFNYNQLSSDPTEEIVKESRGLILERGTWNIVRYGFRRFMNLGELGCDKLDWESIKATSKEDGTLIFVYFYNGWHVGTRNTFDAEEAEIQALGYNHFAELFYEVAEQYGFDFAKLNPNYTFCLELCSRSNRVVVDYEEPKLFHILTRNNATLEELNVDIGIPKPKTYFLANKKEYEKLVNSFDETHEGIVLQDAQNHRAKLKSPLYFELHRMASNHQLTTETIIDMIRTGEDKEFLCYFNSKEYLDLFKIIREKIDNSKKKISEISEQVNQWKKENFSATRKDFSIYAKRQSGLAILWFKAYDNQIYDWFNNLSSKQLIKIFNIGRE